MTHVACTRCGVLCRRERVMSPFTCGKCSPKPPAHCAMCNSRADTLKAVKVFENSGLGGVSDLFLCKDHHKRFVDEFKLWSRPRLMALLAASDREEMNRKFAPSVQRS